MLGGTLIQHIPDSVGRALAHEQPNPRNEPGHSVAVAPGTQLHRIVGADELAVNSAHHQAAADAPAGVVVNATAARRRDRGHRGAALPLLHRRAVASRIPDHRGRREALPRLPRRRDAKRSDAPRRASPSASPSGWRAPASARAAMPSAGSPPAASRSTAQCSTTPGLRRHRPEPTSRSTASPCPSAERARLWRYHKPTGEMVTARDPRGPRDDLRLAAHGHAARGHGRPARLQLRGPAAADQRRRAGAPARAAGHRLARGAIACACTARSTQARLAALAKGITIEGVRYGPIQASARPPAAHQRLARHRAGRGQEPRGAPRAGPSRPAGDAPDPRRLRARSISASWSAARSRRCRRRRSPTCSASSGRRARKAGPSPRPADPQHAQAAALMLKIIGGKHRGRPLDGARRRDDAADREPRPRGAVQHPDARQLARGRHLAADRRPRARRLRRHRRARPRGAVARRGARHLPRQRRQRRSA